MNRSSRQFPPLPTSPRTSATHTEALTPEPTRRKFPSRSQLLIQEDSEVPTWPPKFPKDPEGVEVKVTTPIHVEAWGGWLTPTASPPSTPRSSPSEPSSPRIVKRRRLIRNLRSEVFRVGVLLRHEVGSPFSVDERASLADELHRGLAESELHMQMRLNGGVHG
jgi:hypothetical protein